MSHSFPQSPLETLANELIIVIFEHLDVPILLQCKQLSRFLSTLITNSVALEYKIELYFAHLVDGSPGVLSKSARLRLLDDHQRAWNNVSWSSTLEIPLTAAELSTPELSAWELNNGLLALAANRHLRFVQLPSRLRGISHTEWAFEDIGFNIRDFAMDRSQDLLVIVERFDPALHDPNEGHLRIHLRSLSTGGPHPLAQEETIKYPLPAITEHDPEPWHVMQIYAGYVAVMVQTVDEADLALPSFHSELGFWDWKSGKREKIARGPIHSFGFLSERYVLLGVCRLDPDPPDDVIPDTLPSLDVIDMYDPIHICNLSEPPIMSDLSGSPSPVRCSFTFPPFFHHPVPDYYDDDALRPELSIRTDYSSPIPDLAVPFTTSPRDRLIVVTMNNPETNREPVTLFVRVSALLRMIPISSGMRVIEWKDWGPLHSRMVHIDLSDTWFCYVHGMKAVVPSTQKAHVLELWDFNLPAVKRGVGMHNLDVPPEVRLLEPRVPARFEGYVRQRHLVDHVELNHTGRGNSSIPFTKVFDDDMAVTSLPCRVQTFTTPDPKGSRNFMMTEDSLVLVIDDAKFVILSF